MLADIEKVLYNLYCVKSICDPYPFNNTFCDLTKCVLQWKGFTPKASHIVNHVRPTESHSFLTADVKEQWLIKRLRPYRVGGGGVIVALHCG